MAERQTKHLIAAGTPNYLYLAFSPQSSDEQILEHVRTVYQWDDIVIIRQDHIVLVQPVKNGDEHAPT